jgi:hypothetical protein
LATVRVIIDELERCLETDRLLLPHLGDQLADELELLARALRQREERCVR